MQQSHPQPAIDLHYMYARLLGNIMHLEFSRREARQIYVN